MRKLTDYIPADGDILTGPFSKDGSPHSSVILRVVDNDVYIFPISSQQDTYDKLMRIDCSGLVKLTENERLSIFGARKDKKDMSFVYCGEENLIVKSVFDVQALIYNEEASFVCKASQDLIDRMAISVYNSATITPRNRNTILGLNRH